MAERFMADGFDGEVVVDKYGHWWLDLMLSVLGMVSFDLVNASRPVDSIEFEACRGNDRDLTEFRIGNDAVVAVVSNDNTFASNVNREQLEMLFTDAVKWTDINPEWPDEDIKRYIPTTESGTMDIFVRNMFDGQLLQDLPFDALVSTYVANVSTGRCRAVEREQKFYENYLVCDQPEAYAAACNGANPPSGCTAPPRTHQDVELLIQSEVIKPRVLKSWFLLPSIFNREEIAIEASRDYPNADVIFKSWLSASFITNPQSSTPELAGVRTAILGSLWVVLISVLVAFPLGTAAAIHLEEYADNE